MNNFSLNTPTKILFGKGQIAQLGQEIPADARILITYGGGSIKKNGVLDQVRAALAGSSTSPSVGLGNVDERMRTTYGDDRGIVIETAPGLGTKVTLRVPKFAPEPAARG